MTLPEAIKKIHSCPACITPAITALEQTADLDDPAVRELCRRIYAAMPSMQAMDDLMGDRARLMMNFYPDPPAPTPSTEDTISAFLSTFGSVDAYEQDALEKLIFNPVADYAATLAAEERSTPLPDEDDDNLSDQDRLINSFIRNDRGKAPAPATAKAAPAEQPRAEQSEKQTNRPTQPEAKPKATESSSLTESFVRILIKNRNYTKALEIISEINLNNPEKSIYFADQIRFLKKLIINENKK